MKTQNNNLWTEAIVTVAFVGVGLLRNKKVVEDHQHLLAMTSGALAGHKVGATLGRLIAGPAGMMIGMTAGCVVGCFLAGGHNSEKKKSNPKPEKTIAQ